MGGSERRGERSGMGRRLRGVEGGKSVLRERERSTFTAYKSLDVMNARQFADGTICQNNQY